jgi:hypothetical protein
MMLHFKKFQGVPFGMSVRTLALTFVMVCSNVAAAVPEPPFSGRWRMDTTSLKGNSKPSIFQVSDGTFRKDDNDTVKTDGKFHPVSGGGYVDEQSISIKNDRVIYEVDRIRGILAYTVEYKVSQDGNTLTWIVKNYTNPDGAAVESITVQRRVGLPTVGTHLISGKWERVSISVDSKSDWILKLDGNRFSWRTENGTGYEAIIGGKSVKIDGDNSGARARITRPKPDTIVETDFSAKGEFDDVLSMRLMPDKKTILGVARTRKQKEPTTFYLQRVTE